MFPTPVLDWLFFIYSNGVLYKGHFNLFCSLLFLCTFIDSVIIGFGQFFFFCFFLPNCAFQIWLYFCPRLYLVCLIFFLKVDFPLCFRVKILSYYIRKAELLFSLAILWGQGHAQSETMVSVNYQNVTKTIIICVIKYSSRVLVLIWLVEVFIYLW